MILHRNYYTHPDWLSHDTSRNKSQSRDYSKKISRNDAKRTGRASFENTLRKMSKICKYVLFFTKNFIWHIVGWKILTHTSGTHLVYRTIVTFWNFSNKFPKNVTSDERKKIRKLNLNFHLKKCKKNSLLITNSQIAPLENQIAPLWGVSVPTLGITDLATNEIY